MFPLTKGGEEGQELAFVSWVIVLGGRELFGEAAYELVSSRLVLLVESGAYGMVTRIEIEVELELGILEVHDDLVAHGTFEAVEGGQLGLPPPKSRKL